MSALDELIDHLILEQGPISLATYMGLCLNHPEHGYYANSQAIGADADFITSPEISQFFGEMIGLWCVQLFDQFDAPSNIQLLELGPGKGTLMRDVLKAIQIRNGFNKALDITLLESNKVLQATQQKTLSTHSDTLSWIEDLTDFKRDEDVPLIILGNEFLDALPIRQFQYDGKQWFERLIGIKDGKRVWGLSPDAVQLTPEELPEQAPKSGDIIEISPAQINFMDQLSAILANGPAAALLVDYGYGSRRFGNTFQALKNHQHHDPLKQSGMADLTSLICFDQFTPIMAQHQLNIAPLTSQGYFLAAMGLEARVNQLIAQNPGQQQSIIEGATRLVDPEQMGELFKVMCCTKDLALPHPFNIDTQPELAVS